MQTAIIPERLARLPDITLKSGNSAENEARMCVMEAVAYVAGEPWSDHPKCACPVITAFMVSWNDGLPSDAERNRLLAPLIPRLVGTRNKALEERRSLMAADWLVREHTPAWLRLAGLTTQADALTNLPEITSMAQVPSIRGPLEAARKDADAAGDAARAAAWDAAWAAAGDAARAAAGDAAWDAAWAAAWDAARAAAWAAVWDAARDALAETTATLQQSALRLVERMIAAEPA